MRPAVALAAALALTVAISGCGNKERDELRAKVAGLEQQLAKVNSELAEKDAVARAATEQIEQQLKRAQANIDALTADLVKVKEERDRLKAEVAQLRKRK
jgi:septal ring factor EnvC (AmiA/AmiB activator)